MVFQKNVYQLRKTLFDKLDLLNIPNSDDHKLFRITAIFNFVSICVQEHTNTKTWISKHVPLSVSILSNSIEQPIFLWNSNPAALVGSFVDALDGLAAQSEVQRNQKFWRLKLMWRVNSLKFCPLLINVAVAYNQYCNLKMNVSTKESGTICQFYRHKRINFLICRITWKDTATFLQYSAPTAQNTTKF